MHVFGSKKGVIKRELQKWDNVNSVEEMGKI
jgi:hypothetical protein